MNEIKEFVIGFLVWSIFWIILGFMFSYAYGSVWWGPLLVFGVPLYLGAVIGFVIFERILIK